MRKRARNAKTHQAFDAERFPDPPDITRANALRAIGEVVYAARVGEVIKIGWTTDLQRRLGALKADELLGFIPGNYDDEQDIHKELAIWAARGREWYHPHRP